MALEREIIAPKHPVLPVSPAVRGGDFVFLSGMTPVAGSAADGTVAAETRQILTKMARLLEAAGSSLASVVKVNVLLYSMLEYDNMNTVYANSFPSIRRRARSAA
jgi:2-iminobutanoate/2-iminopropanoate deaminase